jgi:hypothetical protein
MIGTQKAAYRRFRFTAVPPAWGGIAHVDRPAAAFLRSYQLNGGYTPGPLLLLCVLLGLAGSALALGRHGPARRGPDQTETAARTRPPTRRRDPARRGPGQAEATAHTHRSPGQAEAAAHVRSLALACLLFWVTGVVLLLAADITQFSWRYQLPGLVTLPPAAAAGATALLAWSRARRDGRAAHRAGRADQTERSKQTERTAEA